MTSLIETISDKNRLNAARKISPNIRGKPELIVEGYLDRAILTGSCKYFRSSVNITYSQKGKGKEAVIDDFKSRRGDKMVWALVDTDHDFQMKQKSPRMFDTIPYVTLASSIYGSKRKEEAHINGIGRKILLNTKIDGIGKSDYIKIRDISRALNIAKLYSGYSKKGGKYHEIHWSEVTNQRGDEMINEILNLIFPNQKDRLELNQFREEKEAFLSKCGINDHRIEEAFTIFLEFKGVSIKKYMLERYTKEMILETIKNSGQKPRLPKLYSEVMIQSLKK